ncbi:MAG: hypothetical protein KKE39_06310 [Bacteroidetes bacterium]|nr:hypothetical protein [Bacteroidota bacterium]MBU1373147.1 hypothetical protein [Bacteroidota bacterium]MBU1484329.1 hypothetical protein [Bacteroidota bacterium]MBU1760597.1 hypothetical protein [Bacteroidota bacterium]MBU2047153.1 hypothetical protein [Bacteroidota bacterium]
MKKDLKTTIITLIVILFASVTNAQDAKYVAAMKNALQSFNDAKTGADYVAASNQFERIGGIAKTEWLPYYYAAYSQLINNTTLQDPNEKDAVLDKALELVGKAEILKPAEGEIWALKGYISFMKIYVNPMARMQNGMGEAMGYLEKAKALNPENPRPYFVIAQNTFYTPEAFGGGKDAAKPLLTEAAKKFEAFKPTNEMMPDWGKERNAMLLAECK